MHHICEIQMCSLKIIIDKVTYSLRSFQLNYMLKFKIFNVLKDVYLISVLIFEFVSCFLYL